MILDPTPLVGKIAVVLGGTGGIGSAISTLFARAGARVAVVAHADAAKAKAAAGRLPGAGHRGYTCRIEDSAELSALAANIQTDLGSANILINACGFTRNIPLADLSQMDDEIFDRILTVNMRAAFSAVRSFADQLRTGGDGLVVNLSSIAATTGVGSCIAYCAAKAGVDVMGLALARALAPAVRVLTVSPGAVDTDFVPGRDQALREKIGARTPLKRLCTAQDVAETVLACAVCLRYSTGSVIQVDGGAHL
jgi:3-oxoacyl-[acyl-carrier protein] reductase